MEMTIDETIIQATLLKDGVGKDTYKYEILASLIDIAKKYQKIEQIMKSKKMNALNIGLLIPKDMACVLHEIKEVLEDGNYC